VEGRIPPLGQIHARQLVRLAAHARIDLMVGQHHRVHLDRLNVVGVVAENPRKADLSNFRQLFEGEGGGPAAVLVPEAVSGPEVVELAAHDAGKGGTHHCTCTHKKSVGKINRNFKKNKLRLQNADPHSQGLIFHILDFLQAESREGFGNNYFKIAEFN